MAENFNPDAYLAKRMKPAAGAEGFDPDAYLAKRTAPFDPSKPFEVVEAPKPSAAQQVGGAFETAGRGLLESFTLGLSEPIISGTNALITQGERALIGEDKPENEFNIENLKGAYQQDVDRRRLLKEQMPVADIGGGLVGAFSPQGLGAKMVKGISKGADKAVGLLKEIPAAQRAAESTGLLGRAAQTAGSIGRAGFEGAATGAATTAAQQAVEKNTGFMKEGEGPSIGEAAAFGGKFGAGVQGLITAVPAGFQASKYIGKRMLSTVFGPKVEHIESYLQNADRIRNAKSLVEIKDEVDRTVGMLRDDVETGRLNEQQAREGLKAIEQKIKDVTEEARFNFQITKADVAEQLRDARRNLDSKFGAKVDQLKAVKAPISMADDVGDSISQLKKQVSKGSKESYNILEKEAGTVNLQPAFRSLGPIREKLIIAGKGPITNEGRSALAQIDDLTQRVGQLPVQIPFTEAKKLVQQLDSAIDYGVANGAFVGETEQALRGLRSSIDEILKSKSPAYRAKMEEVAAATRLLSETSQRFGKPQSAISKLSRIGSTTSKPDRELLSQLGARTKKDFDTPIKQFGEAQGQLKDPESIRRGLPEYGELRKAETASRYYSRPETRDSFIEGEVGKRGLIQERDKARGLLTEAQKGLIDKEGKLSPFKTITEGTSEAKIKALARGKKGENIELRSMFEDLGKMSDKDFVQAIDDLRVKQAFEGGNQSGSRNVNFWGGLGLVTGISSGDATLSGALTAAGGAMGLMVDRYGPAMAKRILDGVLKFQGKPSVQKIQNMNLPPEVKNYLTQELVRHQGGESQGLIKKSSGQ